MELANVSSPLRKWRFYQKSPYESKWENDGGNANYYRNFVIVNGEMYTGSLVLLYFRLLKFVKKIRTQLTRSVSMTTTDTPNSTPTINVMTKMRKIDMPLAIPDGDQLINIGLTEEVRAQLSDGLCRILADTYSLYLKTQNFHWNVTGPKFISLHLLFEQQYKQLAEAVDVIAERIRALGFLTPASFSKFSEMATIKEENAVPSSAEQMIMLLMQGHETIIKSARCFSPFTERVLDDATHDLLSRRVEEHEKTAWMLRSLLN